MSRWFVCLVLGVVALVFAFWKADAGAALPVDQAALEAAVEKEESEKKENDADTTEKTEETEENSDESDKRKKKKRKRRGRDLPREIIESRLASEDQERQCECCDKPMAELGFDTQERFLHQPATVTIIEERFYKYACSSCDGGVFACPPVISEIPCSVWVALIALR